MDIFSLTSPDNLGGADEGDVDSVESVPRDEENNDDEFETPMSTPRSLFSTPPRTPPRPTSHADDRIRMRRFKLSMSPNITPRPSSGAGGEGGEGLLSGLAEEDPPLRHRITDISFSSAGGDEEEGGDWDESNGSYPSSPNVTPNNSPRKSDLLSLSPIQQRLARAKTKREQILEERVQNIDNKSKEKELQASKRKEDATLTKIEKARTEESINQAKSKRQQILDERVQQIDEKSKLKEKEALKRKEDVTLEIIEKARSELAKSPLAKERRDQQLASRVESLEANLESKTASAQSRLEHHLFEKQQRACCRERKERAERRRTLVSYEKRAKLLAALDAKLERAALKTQQLNEEKVTKAGEQIIKSKEVARKVKAARSIQRAIRKKYGLEIPDAGNLNLSQHDAAERLQRWFQWRARVCKSRFFALEEDDAKNDGDDNVIPKAINALEQLLELFAFAPEENQHRRGSLSPPPIEGLSYRMMQPETLKMAVLVVECIRPIVEVSFCSSEGSVSPRPTSAKSSELIDGRTLLSLSLIAVHPREVLGDDFAKSSGKDEDVESRSTIGSRLLAAKSRALLESLNELQALLSSGKSINENEVLRTVSSLCMQALALFRWWKNMDMEQLLDGLSKQLEQSWAIYLTSSETLKYLAEVTGISSSGAEPKRDDPLMSLRLRHEAGRSGSRSHIKRIRLSLNKLVGPEEGKEVVKNAKMAALKEIGENGTMKDLKGEIDEIYGGMGSPSTLPDLPAENATAASTKEPTGTDSKASSDEPLAMSVDLPDELLSNRMLVHRILLTDPIDFDILSWDGTNAQSTNVALEEFMASFISIPDEQNDGTPRSMEDMSMRIAKSMRTALFQQIAQDVEQGSYKSVRELLTELHNKMRSLLPSRKDLHSHLNDEHISSCSSMTDILQVLIRSGYLLANYLESPVRAPTTRELIECLEAFNSGSKDGNSVIPYQIQSQEMFAVASTAFILHKAELCQMDVSNYKLSQAAPLLHHIGHQYERKHFQQTFGDYSSSSIDDLLQMLPSTWNWVKKMHRQFGDSENLTPQSNHEQKMDLVRGRGFVDGILFTRSQLALPEFFSLDAGSINHIRNEARCCVIASALALHACNISKVGTSVLSSNVMTDEVNTARQMLSSVLRKKHFKQTELKSNVGEAVGTLTKALAERDLTEEELEALKNHTFAVLHGNDPVLKLLDNRVQSFFRFACKWKSDTSTSTPLEIKTGRSVLKTDNIAPARTGIKSTKAEFMSAAKKEASRLGFGYFGSDLIEVGNEARGIISLACSNYGQDILERFFNIVWEGMNVPRSRRGEFLP